MAGGWRVNKRKAGEVRLIRHLADYKQQTARLFSKDNLAQLGGVLAARIDIESDDNNFISSEHYPASVAIASNLPETEPIFLCRTRDDEPISQIVRSFVDTLHDLQSVAATYMHERFAAELAELEGRIAGLRDEIAKVIDDSIESKRRQCAEVKIKSSLMTIKTEMTVGFNYE